MTIGMCEFESNLITPQLTSRIDNYSGKEIEKGGPIRTVRISKVHRCSSVTSRLPTRSAD
ncbi:unnamed protein product [Trichogramma brassicae]|uniref:Uncharacterized protein n=1 Tax=Trichogramma brassicae TaxID=86971 RepID=A0A6H5HX32_9HYME|nr:unnamed protein product [Trichogramma brassicae]